MGLGVSLGVEDRAGARGFTVTIDLKIITRDSTGDSWFRLCKIPKSHQRIPGDSLLIFLKSIDILMLTRHCAWWGSNQP